MLALIKHHFTQKNEIDLKPNSITKKSVRFIVGKSVLDIGVGSGRDVLYLAKKGFNVVGVDISTSALKELKKICKDKKLKISLKNKPIETFSYKKKYNAVFCLNVLPFIAKKDVKNVISSMKSNTSKGGVNTIKVFTTKDPAAKKNKHKLTYFKTNELKSYYKDWKIIYYKEYLSKPEKHKNNPMWHRHHIAELIAIKQSF